MSNHSETVTLPISGMSCAACQIHVERALQQTAGVSAAQVNLMHHNARVTFDPSVAKMEQLIGAVRDAGYDATAPAPVHHEHEDAGEESTLKWRAIATIAAGALAMVLSMPLMHAHGWLEHALMASFPFLYRLPISLLGYVLLIMTAVGMFWAGNSVYRGAWKAAIHGTSNMNTLVSLGTLAALAYSATATLAPRFFTAHGMQPDVYYESVLLILGFLLLGKWLETRARHRTVDALEAFAKMQPRTARLLRDGNEVEVPLEEVHTGDTLVIRPGEQIPVDGMVLSGHSSIDESLITGESVPVARGEGDRVIGGSINYDGTLAYRATAVGEASMLGQMLRLMEEAQSSKAPMQQMADRASAIFVPVVLVLAALSFVVWVWADPAHGITRAFTVAVAVLVIACPCAMGLAVPAALTVAIGRGAQMGLLFKGGESIERLAHVDTIVLDKTGTLTRGKPEVRKIHTAAGLDERELLVMAASLEQRSEHPLAHAVMKRAADENRHLKQVKDLRVSPGKGLSGVVDGRIIAAGNAAMMRDLQVSLPTLNLEEASTLLYIAIDGRFSGVFEVRDALRPGAKDTVQALHALGLKTVMLTGDSKRAAELIAQEAGIKDIRAELLPDEKLAAIRALQAEKKLVAMVGDGINDAAALAQADAGLAIGTGTDLAREAGDVILLHGDPQQIVDAIRLARQTVRVMRQNLGWAAGYNVVGIPVAAGVLYPLWGLLLNPVIASAAMALSSLSVLANSLRLRSFRYGR